MQILFVGRQRGFKRAVIQFMGWWRRRSGMDVPETIQGKWFVIINSDMSDERPHAMEWKIMFVDERV
jgi:hypothetical protein